MSLYITLDAGTSNSVRFCGVTTSAERSAYPGGRARNRHNRIFGKPFPGHCRRHHCRGSCLKAGIAPEAVDVVLASGMIASNLGLKEIPHLVLAFLLYSVKFG